MKVMRRVLMFSILAPIVFVPAADQVEGKGHVPVGKAQVCHKGTVIGISHNAVQAHVNHGDCQLPACDFANIFHTGDACNPVHGGDGKCMLNNDREDAGGVTPGCPPGTF